MLVGWSDVLSLINTDGSLPALRTLPGKIFSPDPSSHSQKGLGSRLLEDVGTKLGLTVVQWGKKKRQGLGWGLRGKHWSAHYTYFTGTQPRVGGWPKNCTCASGDFFPLRNLLEVGWGVTMLGHQGWPSILAQTRRPLDKGVLPSTSTESPSFLCREGGLVLVLLELLEPNGVFGGFFFAFAAGDLSSAFCTGLK